MGRPALPIGNPGKIQFGPLSDGHTQSRVPFRDYDGRVRLVSKNGRTRAAAERALKIGSPSVRPRPAPCAAVQTATANPCSTRREDLGGLCHGCPSAPQGLLVQPRPKTAAGGRVVALPDFAVDMIRARPATGPDGLVSTGPVAGTPRDPSSASGDLRQLLDSFECDACGSTGYALAADGSFAVGLRGQRIRCDVGPWSWVTSHVCRKTVATRLDEARLSPPQVADQLGHVVVVNPTRDSQMALTGDQRPE